jgi:hypothetical protein
MYVYYGSARLAGECFILPHARTHEQSLLYIPLAEKLERAGTMTKIIIIIIII